MQEVRWKSREGEQAGRTDEEHRMGSVVVMRESKDKLMKYWY